MDCISVFKCELFSRKPTEWLHVSERGVEKKRGLPVINAAGNVDIVHV